MATWITHLRIAENLLARIPDLDQEYFTIGNIAPDSGVPDEKWENFDPPPDITHYYPQKTSSPMCADLEFYRSYLEQKIMKDNNTQENSFLLGYFFHLLIDNLWQDEIFDPIKEKFAGQFEADPRFIWTVKHDWYGLDFVYVNNNPNFWQMFLDFEYKNDFLAFLPIKAVQIRLNWIKDYYQRSDSKTKQWYKNRPGIYLTKEEMDRFVEQGTKKILSVYDLLIKKNIDITNYISALELIE